MNKMIKTKAYMILLNFMNNNLISIITVYKKLDFLINLKIDKLVNLNKKYQLIMIKFILLV